MSTRPDGFSEIDRPKLGDEIFDATHVLKTWKTVVLANGTVVSPRERMLAVALEELIKRAEETEKILKEFI